MTGGSNAAEPGTVDGTTAPNLPTATLRASGAALLGAGILVGSAGPIGLSWGLIAVAVFVGWLIGSAARSGAHGEPRGGRPTRTSDPRIRAIALAGALFAWLIALVGLYLYSLRTISDVPDVTSFISYYAQQLGPLDLIEVVVLLAAAWWSAR